ncbi:hypothetical protein GHK86_21975, partial [Acidimicrobiaceae bacterium USS-CC1]|nr:hypothetical protein [Acidiferrimicrobium australe]
MSAHRGASGCRPENTMAAFRAGVAAGADAVELDVHATADHHLVVIHDYDLARTTDGDGLVHERTLAEVRALSAGRWYDEAYAAERVPLLAEVLALPGVELEVELKGLPSERLVDGVCRAVEASGAAGRVQVTGAEHMVVAEVKRRLPAVTAGLFLPPREPGIPAAAYQRLVEESAAFGGFAVVHGRLSGLRALDLGRLHARGLAVQAGDVSGRAEILEAVGLGVDRLSTGDPAAAL